MEKLPAQPYEEREPERMETEFSLLHFRRSGRPSSRPATEKWIWSVIKWIAGVLIGALLTWWISGQFP
ncbi:MAG TPA: hypothetical protein VFJ16_25630 [Longimicrobium sp.]|nr:hypothetical protein [Longimicrobium sp.]